MGISTGKISRLIKYQSLVLEGKELEKKEQDLLAFLLIATGEEEEMIGKILRRIKDAIANSNRDRKRKQDLDFEIRTEELVQALHRCGIPLWVARRNAKAFMVLRPDFDLRSPRHSKLRSLLEYHQDQFLEAYYEIARSKGSKAANEWMKFIRENDIFFARICQLPDDFAVRYLFA